MVRDFATSPPRAEPASETPAPAVEVVAADRPPAIPVIAVEAPAPAEPEAPAPAEPPPSPRAEPSPPPVGSDRTKLWIGGAAAVVALALIWRCNAADTGDARPPVAAATSPAADRPAAKFDAAETKAPVIAGGGAAHDEPTPGAGAARGAGAEPAEPRSADAAEPAAPTTADAPTTAHAPTNADAPAPDEVPTRTDAIAEAPAPASERSPTSSGRTTPIGSSSARADDTRKLSAEELLTLARQAWKDGNARDTFKYANQSRYKQPSAEATELSTLAACKMHQTDSARSSFDDLDGDRRRRVRTACRDMGVRVGL